MRSHVRSHLSTSALVVAVLSPITLFGQASGSRGSFESITPLAPQLSATAIENYITVEATVEQRLEPTAARVVLALVAEAESAADCRAKVSEREQKLRTALEPLGLEKTAVVTDFISILPLYEWTIEKREEQSVAVEKPSGFRMQTNVHVKVASDAQAAKLLDQAFSVGVTDIIAFDYMSDELDATKKTAREAALDQAKAKADFLLDAMFEEAPRPLNVQEQTRTIFPRSKYASFENTRSLQFQTSYSSRQQLPRISAAKPQNVYYRGFQEQADIRGGGLPMTPTISVVSTVRLYYAAPSGEDEDDDEHEEGGEADLDDVDPFGGAGEN